MLVSMFEVSRMATHGFLRRLSSKFLQSRELEESRVRNDLRLLRELHMPVNVLQSGPSLRE